MSFWKWLGVVINLSDSQTKEVSDNTWKVIICFFSIELIVFLCCRDMSKLNSIAVLNDEFGYWGTAASIAGYDWKELIAETPYYSFGYSLLLVPVILLFPTPILWYKAAIVLNVLLLIISYFICIKIGTELFPEIDTGFIMLISILVTIYPGNIVYAQVAWSETLQYFLVWCITYLIIKLDKNFSAFKIFGIILLLIYMYCVHNRNIGVTAVAMLCIFLCFWKHKKSIILYILPVGALILGYFALKQIKAYEITVLWSNSAASEMNNLSISGSTFLGYFSALFKNLVLYCESVYGKLFYILLATGFTFPIVVFNVAKEVVNNVKQKDIFKDFLISKVWCTGILVVMLFLSALQMMDWTYRRDIIIYARYMEHTIGPVLLLGMVYTLFYVKKVRRGILFSVIIFCIGINGVYQRINNNVNPFFNSICAPLFGAFHDNNDNMKKVFAWIIVAMVVMVAGIIIASFLKDKNAKLILPVIIYITVFSVEGFFANTYMDNARKNVEAGALPLYEQIVQFEQKEIYYVKDTTDDQYSINPKYLQFMIPEYKIHLIEREQINTVMENEALILINPDDRKTEKLLLLKEKADKLESTTLLKLYIKQAR